MRLALVAAAWLVAQDAFVPADFEVPLRLEADDFIARKLLESDAEKDYEAVMSSVAHLRGAFGPDSEWPPDDLTLARNREELRWHESEFDARRSFAYTVVTPDESRVLGCVYVNPTRKRGFDAEVYLWVRRSAYERGMDERLFRAVRRWLVRSWPFDDVAYPGRTVDWSVWEELDER